MMSVLVLASLLASRYGRLVVFLPFQMLYVSSLADVSGIIHDASINPLYSCRVHFCGVRFEGLEVSVLSRPL